MRSRTTSVQRAAIVARARLRAQEMIEQGAPLRDVLAQLTGAVEAVSHGSVASILILDKDGLLRNGASPSLPAAYLDAIDRLRPGPNGGTCAAAAATGQIVVTPDIQLDRKWTALAHLPLALGFVAAWSMPIRRGERHVLGTFGTYLREKRWPSPDEMKVVASLVPVAAAAIEAQLERVAQ